MVLTVADECVRLGLRTGAVVFRGVQVTARSPELAAEIFRQMEVVRAKYATSQALRTIPEVVAFREVLRKAGVNPCKVQPSVERLLNLALKRGDLPSINCLVDAYNLVSVRSLCSLGAHDLDRIALPIELRLLTGAETFLPLGRGTVEPTVAGEFGYVDAAGRVLCRLDVLQAESSKVTTATVNALLIVEGTRLHSRELLQQAFSETIDRVTYHCGGMPEIAAFPDP